MFHNLLDIRFWRVTKALAQIAEFVGKLASAMMTMVAGVTFARHASFFLHVAASVFEKQRRLHHVIKIVLPVGPSK